MREGFIEPPPELFANVMARIKQEQELKRARTRSWIFASAALGSFAGIILVFNSLYSELSQSGIPQMLASGFLDASAISAIWSDAMFFFLESLPTVSLALFFCVAFIFLGSFKLLAKNVGLLPQFSQEKRSP